VLHFESRSEKGCPVAEKIFTSDERKQFEALAHRRGFKSLRKYLHTLIQRDVEQHGEAVDADDELDDPIESFRAGWAQAMRGEGITWEELKRSIENDD
jgi:hypothetical protein